jgi:hypothetical protein
VWQLDKRHRYGRGRAFALYVMAYTVGRFWIEALRVDTAHHFLGLRINDWTSIIVFLAALLYFVRVKGPQTRLVADEDGRLRAVAVDAPDGAAAGQAEQAEAEKAEAADAESVDAKAGDEDAEGDSGGADPPAGPQAAEPEAGTGEHADDPAHSTAEK